MTWMQEAKEHEVIATGRSANISSRVLRPARRSAVRRLAVVAALAGLLVACGGQKLPSTELSTSELLDPTPTVAAALPNDDQVEDTDTDPPDEEPTAVPREQAEPDPDEDDATAAGGEDTVLVTGDTWTDATANLVGLQSECGTVHYLSAHPYRDDLFVGVAANGMFRLDDESGDWVPLGTSPSSDRVDNRLAWIEYEPSDPNRFWQAGIYGTGVYLTEDGGATFSQQGDVRHVDYVSTDPTDPNRAVMLAGGHEDRILYRSTDGGRSWDDIAERLPEEIGFTHYPIVVDASTFLLGTIFSDNAGIFRSSDGGTTWTTVYSGGVSGPPLIDGTNIYWLAEQGNGLIVSNDGGETFTLRPERIGGRPTTLSLLQDGSILTHSEQAALISNDEGATWVPAGPPIPFAPKGIVMSSTENAIYAWTFTCSSPEAGDSVAANSIVRLDVLGSTSADR